MENVVLLHKNNFIEIGQQSQVPFFVCHFLSVFCPFSFKIRLFIKHKKGHGVTMIIPAMPFSIILNGLEFNKDIAQATYISP
jgi:hypothetical protein